MRYAGTLQRLAELVADHGDSSTYTEKREHIQAKVTELCGEIDSGIDEHKVGKWLRAKCIPVFSNDPRGAVLKIRVPDGFSDDGNGEGICVPS